MSRLIAAGAAAPDFTADASDGRTYRLSDLLAESRHGSAQSRLSGDVA